MRVVRSYLIVTDAGMTRTVKRFPHYLARDEYAFKLEISIPDAPSRWGADVELQLPVPNDIAGDIEVTKIPTEEIATEPES